MTAAFPSGKFTIPQNAFTMSHLSRNIIEILQVASTSTLVIQTFLSYSSHLQTHLSCSDWSVVAQSSFPCAVMLEVRGSRFADFLNKSLQRRALVSQCCSCKPFPTYTESHRIQIPVIPEEQIQSVQTSPKLGLSFYRVHPAGRRVKETAVPLE